MQNEKIKLLKEHLEYCFPGMVEASMAELGLTDKDLLDKGNEERLRSYLFVNDYDGDDDVYTIKTGKFSEGAELRPENGSLLWG